MNLWMRTQSDQGSLRVANSHAPISWYAHLGPIIFGPIKRLGVLFGSLLTDVFCSSVELSSRTRLCENVRILLWKSRCEFKDLGPIAALSRCSSVDGRCLRLVGTIQTLHYIRRTAEMGTGLFLCLGVVFEIFSMGKRSKLFLRWWEVTNFLGYFIPFWFGRIFCNCYNFHGGYR